MVDLRYLINTFPKGELVDYDAGRYITRIHTKIADIYWLIEGEISFVLPLEGGDEVEVCKTSAPFIPIGWTGLESPARHTKSIRASSGGARLYRVPLPGDEPFLNTLSGPDLQMHVCRKQFLLLKEAFYRQKGFEDLSVNGQPEVYGRTTEQEEGHQAASMLFSKSPFLEAFDDTELDQLARASVRVGFGLSEVILKQDHLSEGLYVLADGKIDIYRYEEGRILSQWPITQPGFIFGWAAAMDEQEFCNAVAISASVVYFIPMKKLRVLMKNNTFSMRFHKRLNWLIDNHISAAFFRYLGFLSEASVLTIRCLIENYKSQISIYSGLHQVPHLLGSSTTKHLAFNVLESLSQDGSSRERRMASIISGLLGDEKKDLEFQQQLQKVYETVTQTKGCTAEQLRRACAAEIRTLCRYFDYEIEGMDKLSDGGGKIFIYNHLRNDPYYTLNNGFQITPDSHFISSVLLDPIYGDPGIRTVRVGSGSEFAHQNYYERLGYINVLTKQSGESGSVALLASRKNFFDRAKLVLQQGINLLISPEGTSYGSEE